MSIQSQYDARQTPQYRELDQSENEHTFNVVQDMIVAGGSILTSDIINKMTSNTDMETLGSVGRLLFSGAAVVAGIHAVVEGVRFSRANKQRHKILEQSQ